VGECRRSLSLAVAVAFALGLVSLAACRKDAPPTPNRSAPVETLDAAPRRVRAATRDVTFLAVSDTHFGYVSEDTHAGLVKKLDGIAGRPYPPEIGGTVATPRALLVTGDLTEWGREDEWTRFAFFYASTPSRPSAAGLHVPVYEVIGNHDKVAGPWVGEQVAARHGGSPYAFDLDDVHFLALGEAPDDAALAWLARDLAGVDKNVPLVVYFHLALLGPWSTGNWFGDGDFKERLAKLLEGRCEAAIFHGHHHASGHYAWHGFSVFKPGAVKDDAHTFAVTRVANGTMTIAYFDYDRDAWTFSQTKSVCD
jgi:hypothetical protein